VDFEIIFVGKSAKLRFAKFMKNIGLTTYFGSKFCLMEVSGFVFVITVEIYGMPSPDGSGILFPGSRTRSSLRTGKKIQRKAGNSS